MAAHTFYALIIFELQPAVLFENHFLRTIIQTHITHRAGIVVNSRTDPEIGFQHLYRKRGNKIQIGVRWHLEIGYNAVIESRSSSIDL